MRTGKTIIGAMAHDPKRGPLVVVAPLSTRAVWLGWLKRIYPGTPIAVCAGRKIDKDLLKYPIIFIHWDLIKSWQVLMPIGTLVLDEAQAITNKDTRRSMAAGLLASRAEKVIAATGTPIQDRPKDLWNIVGMLAPGAWGSYYDFGYRYGDPVQTAYGVDFPGLSNADELRARLSEVMIRRLWKDVQTDLPPISRNIVIADVDEPTRRKLDVLAGKLKSEKSNTAGNLSHYRSQLCKTKLKTVVTEIRKCIDRKEPVVVWTWHKEFAKLIQDELESFKIDAESIQAHLIHGDINPDKREAILDLWKSRPADVLIATMAVAQVGIDLSHAHLAIFAELDYQPAILAQAEMRTYSPLRSMNITFVVADHIIDQRIIRALISKLGSSDPVGLGAAVDAIDAIRDAIEGPRQDPDMERFLDDLLASAA
jgi:SWI/SNF-related matrix-associated actin-dependent regulator 1 of chromatin subfamily A